MLENDNLLNQAYYSKMCSLTCVFLVTLIIIIVVSFLVLYAFHFSACIANDNYYDWI